MRDVELWSGDRAASLQRGAKPLKKLSARHRQIIALLLQGWSNNDVAELFGMTPSRISIVRNDPLVREVMGRHLEDADARIGTLMPAAIDAVREGLSTERERMKAAEMVFRMNGKFKDGDSREAVATAEDVARQIIQVRGGEVTIATEFRAPQLRDTGDPAERGGSGGAPTPNDD